MSAKLTTDWSIDGNSRQLTAVVIECRIKSTNYRLKRFHWLNLKRKFDGLCVRYPAAPVADRYRTTNRPKSSPEVAGHQQISGANTPYQSCANDLSKQYSDSLILFLTLIRLFIHLLKYLIFRYFCYSQKSFTLLSYFSLKVNSIVLKVRVMFCQSRSKVLFLFPNREFEVKF